MEIKHVGSQASQVASTESFTGYVRVDPLFAPPAPARHRGAHVTFEPGSRTAWHAHPLGQTLLVVAGVGWVQREGEEAQKIRPGDVVWIAPGEKHWHGATANTAMTHVAVQEHVDGTSVEWMEKVSDFDYSRLE